ncbi:ClpXP protease specificity-enhancing factor SspB [Candidatus Mesenet endosymbiont of Agriotes lineatus]|uniref:ClpXP protease specificity-enhancing factor SspB n=1 Tax=Candidatus Mesenet endosymbiont of Agriotes lineatus TaxID=3077948 RepID=UPI0030D2201D
MSKYNKLINIMMYMVIRDALNIMSQSKSESCHIRMSFLTNANNVVIPDYLKKEYPSEMPIVLQHQFDDLVVSDCNFSVVLRFHGKKERIAVPFVAITKYCDVNCGFSVDFNKNLSDEAEIFLRKNHFLFSQIQNTAKQNSSQNVIFLNNFLKDS